MGERGPVVRAYVGVGANIDPETNILTPLDRRRRPFVATAVPELAGDLVLPDSGRALSSRLPGSPAGEPLERFTRALGESLKP